MNQARLISIMAGDDRSTRASLTRAGLAFLELFYRLGIRLRNAAFDRGFRKSHRLPRPVISIGNITTGGTGKTPLVMELTRRLRAEKTAVAILIRGFKGGAQGSDEATVLKEELRPDVVIEVDADRAAAAGRALKRRPDVGVFLLDDGFQHRQIARDLNLVLIDATRPWGLGHVLPRGLLREPLTGLRRADAVIITRADQVTPEELVNVDRKIARYHGRPPIAHAVHDWIGFRDPDDRPLPIEMFRDSKVLAISAIGNPHAFEAALRVHVRGVIDHLVFDDHHDFGDIAGIFPRIEAAKKQGAIGVVMTEKDWVKWKLVTAKSTPPLPVYRPVLRIRFLDGGDELDALLRTTIQTRPPS